MLSGSPLRSSMALARGLRGSRKGLRRLRLACLWWSSRLSVCWAPSLHLWTRVSREHRRSCTYKEILYTFNRHLRRGFTLFTDDTDLTWSHALDNMGVFLIPSWVHIWRWVSVQEFRADLSWSQRVKTKSFNDLVLSGSFYRPWVFAEFVVLQNHFKGHDLVSLSVVYTVIFILYFYVVVSKLMKNGECWRKCISCFMRS